MTALVVRESRTPQDATKDGKHVTNRQLSIICGVLLCIGASVGVGGVLWGVGRAREVIHLDRHGVSALATVTTTTEFSAPSGSVCLTYRSGSTTVRSCPAVSDPSGFHSGQSVSVRYDRAHPTRVVVVGQEPDLTPMVLLILAGSGIVLAVGLLLAKNWRDDDDDGEQLTGVGWVQWMTLAGFTSWLGIGYAARRMGRRRVLWWVPVYGTAAVATVVLFVASTTRTGLEPVAVGLWLAVWIGGTVHGLLLVPTVCRERVRMTEHRHSNRLPPPPPSPAASVPTLPRRSVVGLVDLRWLADPHITENGEPVPVLHAGNETRVLCGATTSFLLPTLHSWPRSGRNPTDVCPVCTSMIDPPRFGRRPRSESESEPRPVGTTRPMWVWNDGTTSGGFLSIAALVVLTVQAIAVGVGFNPDVGGSPVRGLGVLLVCLLADVLLVARRPRPRTEVHPWGVVMVGLWSRRTLQWDDVAFFGATGVVLHDGSRVQMAHAHQAESIRAALNRRCGVNEPVLPYPWGQGLVEIPMAPTNEPRAAGSSGVLHAVGPNGGPACGPTEALCLPTFRPWRTQGHGCLEVCRRCQELVPMACRGQGSRPAGVQTGAARAGW